MGSAEGSVLGHVGSRWLVKVVSQGRETDEFRLRRGTVNPLSEGRAGACTLSWLNKNTVLRPETGKVRGCKVRDSEEEQFSQT
jgi:hypothetical protein